ncbi:helix-turn-helix transcriptional regulator [Frankia sp. QA3]|uniref:helix-turn-helix transcriptional regulator n=1 Tax=Frankia sp. QA3 TaxID=710111 RepID=UPI000269C0F9|nr:helix-turn-helix transcriptional regulator [Frankia sp. QA3]EIV92522.1 response regulator containing a CheY-like receiver domain and an HTH DNA-binding domain [Frankia sp. QA3]
MTVTAGDRRHSMFPAPAGDRGWRRRERELGARLAFLHGEVRAALGIEPSRGTVLASSASWTEVVSDLVRLCVDRLRAMDGHAGATGLRICLLVLDLHELAFDLGQHERDQRMRRLAACSEGLARMRVLPHSTDLLDHACEELVRRCGFGRAVLSRVDEGVWRPWLAYFSNGDEFESWFGRWVDQPIRLEGRIPETRLLTECQPVAVYDTASTAVHRSIIVDSGRSDSYVVAPLMHGTSVVGFLHADHHPASRRVDDFDRDVLWAFAEGFSHLYERIVLAERLRTQRDQAREILSSAVESVSDFCDASIDFSPHAAVGAMPRTSVPPHPVPTGHPGGELTARESEVLELMVAGATNGAIAETLVISEDTVKSHVKHILRKLGAVNRSQAIARSLGIAVHGDGG